MQHRFKRTSRFKKDYKKVSAFAHFDEKNFVAVLHTLAQSKKLPVKYKNHKLKGIFKHCLECHLQNDILLIYEISKTNKTITLHRIGTHSELF